MNKLKLENLQLKIKLIESQGQILQMQHAHFSREIEELQKAEETENDQE